MNFTDFNKACDLADSINRLIQRMFASPNYTEVDRISREAVGKLIELREIFIKDFKK